jgi:hypothetical protein
MAFRLRARPAIDTWTVDQVSDFLEMAGIDADIRQRFKDEAVDGGVLRQITDSDLSSEPFRLPFGVRKTLLAEVQAQHVHARARERQGGASQGMLLVKGVVPDGPQLSVDALERVRRWRLEPASGRLVPREPPLSDEELECWQYQAAWLVCPITGKAWGRSDVVSTMGVALYHAPRSCSDKEKQRRFIEEEQARRYDAARKAIMDHSGTTFDREYEVYPIVEPPPIANLPKAVAGSAVDADDVSVNADQLQQLKMEASGLKGRSAAVQRQMFEGLAGGDQAGISGSHAFLSDGDVRSALNQLKVEPKEDGDLTRKFSLYESYFDGVVNLRSDLFGLWEKGRELLRPHDARSMTAALRRVDTFENLSIPDRSRFWFVYHMMSTASENHAKMQRVLEDLEELFEAACDRRDSSSAGVPSEDLSDDPQLGVMEVIIGPAFDIDAYNDGVNGNKAKGILPAADRGVSDMDRQYNAVNFQYFTQRADAGVTRTGAEASYERRFCTSRLSFYIEESHGSRVFPRNILSQLSLLFYRRNDALRLPGGQVHEQRVAVCIRKAIPRILRAIVIDVFHGDRSFAPRVEKAVRLYLAVHQVAIKLLATFRKSFELLYQSVVQWIQQPFCPRSASEWPDLEELLLGASLCSLPWPLLREAFVRKLLVQLLEGTAQMNAKATGRQRAEHIFSQNHALLERLAFIMAFFQAGPGKLPVQAMDRKYVRCAGTLPKAERDALVLAAKEDASVASFVELWGILGMRRSEDVDEDMVLRHIDSFLVYVEANKATWLSAPPPAESSEGPALPPAALEQLARIGAEACGGAAAHGTAPGRPPLGRRERELAEAQRRAAERAQHQGYPVLPASRKLDGTMCYYCHRRFPSRMALFAHLRRVIDKERFIEGHHQTHFALRVPGGPAVLTGGSGPCLCAAEHCGKEFANAAALACHYQEMGVPGFEELPAVLSTGDGEAVVSQSSVQLREETGLAPEAAPAGGDDAGSDLSRCTVCMDRAPNAVMVPCGHIYACEACGKKLRECALCRTPVTQVLRIYYSSDPNL